MSCPSEVDVQAILGSQYDPEISLAPFIDAATLVLDQVIACAAKKGIALTDDEKAMLTKYLAAHFYGSADQFYESRRTGRASGSFRGQTQMGLNGTLYGQNAKLLDRTGCLESLDSGVKIRLGWLGKPPSEQIPYWERR